MKAAAKALRDEAKAAAKNARAVIQATTCGSIKQKGITGHYARIQYHEDSTEKEISGPCRRSERRARRDLELLRNAASGVADRAGGFAAMHAKNRELHQEAEFEAKVAMGLAQYGHSYEKRKDPAGRDYFWALWSEPNEPPQEPADVTELRRGNATLTPLKFDLTEQKLLQTMPHWNLKS